MEGSAGVDAPLGSEYRAPYPLVTEDLHRFSAIRVDNDTLSCQTPNVLLISDSSVPRNVYVPISISFDGEIYSTPSYFVYFAQPDIGRLYPPVGVTGGNSMIRIELAAGERYDRPLDGFIALDFKPIQHLTQPKCLFKRAASTNRFQRGLFYECGYGCEMDTEDTCSIEACNPPTPDSDLLAAQWAFESREDEITGQPYISQQIMCRTPGNPNPGSYYYLEVSLDNGETYCYEDGQKSSDAPKFRYFADTQIVTEDRETGYNAQTFFRTAASDRKDWDSKVEIRFQYSCGYSPSYSSFIRCKFDDGTGNPLFSEAVTGMYHEAPGQQNVLEDVRLLSPPIPDGEGEATLRLGADSINSVYCVVPQMVMPAAATLQLSLNGVDYTPIDEYTVFVWFGRAVEVNGGWVNFVGDSDVQNQFTTKAARTLVFSQIVVCQIVDSAMNYVSEDADYQNAPSHMSIELVQNGKNNTVVLTDQQDLASGMTYYSGISLFKPRQGNYEVKLRVDGLISGLVPMTIVTGDMNISNSVLVLDNPVPKLDVTPGIPFQFTVSC
eukprot:SAG11_NODE_209_length_12331_cov_3.126226_2_plen_551_part_00